jgi:hypothetical protein
VVLQDRQDPEYDAGSEQAHSDNTGAAPPSVPRDALVGLAGEIRNTAVRTDRHPGSSFISESNPRVAIQAVPDPPRLRFGQRIVLPSNMLHGSRQVVKLFPDSVLDSGPP